MARYQSLPCRETKPKTKWSCLWNTLPNLTKIGARRAKLIGGFGLVVVPLPTLTKAPFWLGHRRNIVLPIITSRGVKYTHNDINDTVLHSNRGPRGLCGISPASNQEVIPVGDGGAQHRYIDPPTTWPSAADPDAVATIPQGGPPGLDPTTTSEPRYDPDRVCEANNFGKEFLRMAGIVQMLHRHRPPYDKYPYAHPKRVRLPQSTRDQTRS